jgi:A/G-specific adenine glycosylase
MKRIERIQYTLPTLFTWYTIHARLLPWRKTDHPYHVLISEIMLQQTQVERVTEKYQEFLHTFPSITTLAQAPTNEVIRIWAGLGYNRRALFLQKTARTIHSTYQNKFPETLKELITLPGIGDYTARAILSFAFDQPVPMMDTNHRRIYTRIFFGLAEKKDSELLQIGEKLISTIFKQEIKNIPFGKKKSNMYHWNQLLMDFGSIMCTSTNPKCMHCPIQSHCKAYPKSLTEFTREKKKKKTTTSIPFRQTDRYYRGRIIDLLRNKKTIAIKTLYTSFSDIPKKRIHHIIKKLIQDGLIEQKKQIIFLPK